MSDDSQRDSIADEELRSLLHRRGTRVDLPPFAQVSARATRQSHGLRRVALVGALAIGLLFLWRGPVQMPAASPSAAPCEPAGSAIDGPYPSGDWLWGQLETVAVDRATNQLTWTLRFGVRAGAPGPAIVSARARVLVEGRDLTIAGYEVLAPAARGLSADEQLRIDPCGTLVLAIRTSGPLVDGTFTYAVAIDKVIRPSGETSTESFTARLTCANATLSCTPTTAAAIPSANPSASAIASTTPSASATVLLDHHFGVVYAGLGSGSSPDLTPTVRREGDISAGDRLVGNFSNAFIGAISPDGRRAVYFAQPQGAPWGLYLFDAAQPSQQQRLLELPKENPGGAPAWSSDGRGVAFTVVDEGATQATPRYAAVRTLDLNSATVREVARRSDGSAYELVGWDASTRTLGALLIPHGSAPSNFLQLGAAERSFPLHDDTRILASSDSRLVAVVTCAASSGCALRTTTLVDFANQTDADLGSGLSLGLIGFRPGSNEIALTVGTPGTSHVELWSQQTGRRPLLPLDGQAPDTAFFRADGRALFVSPRPGQMTVIDLQTGTTALVPQPQSGPFPTMRPVGSIRYD